MSLPPDAALLHEVLLLSLSPSPSKWRCHFLPSLHAFSHIPTSPVHSLTLFLTPDHTLAFKVTHSNTDFYYKITDLQARLALKRSPATFKSIYTLWRYVNPVRHKAITQQVGLRVLRLAAEALNLDFSGLSWVQTSKTIVFKDFYDAIFELLDCGTDSKQCCDYVKLVSSVVNRVLNSEWFKKGVPEGVGARGRKTAFEGWMLPFFEIFPETQATRASPVHRSPGTTHSKRRIRQLSLNTTLRVDPTPDLPQLTQPEPFRIDVKLRPRIRPQGKSVIRTRPNTSKCRGKVRTSSLVLSRASPPLTGRGGGT